MGEMATAHLLIGGTVGYLVAWAIWATHQDIKKDTHQHQWRQDNSSHTMVCETCGKRGLVILG